VLNAKRLLCHLTQPSPNHLKIKEFCQMAQGDGYSNGVVQYETTLNADSSSDASAAVSLITSLLSQQSTLSSITNTAQVESSGSSLSMTSLTVNSNTAGSTTETESIKSTSLGQLTTNVDTTGLSASDIEEMKSFFEDAIASQLISQGILPDSSFVTVNSITNGVVDYVITMFNDPSADVTSIAASIDSTLSQFSTLAAIQDSVISDSSGVVEGTSVTTSGELTVSGLSISSGDSAEAATYFTAALTETLTSQGVLPDGAVFTVTSVGNGAVQYEITLSANSSTDAS
jgi:hypothetical protein